MKTFIPVPDILTEAGLDENLAFNVGDLAAKYYTMNWSFYLKEDQYFIIIKLLTITLLFKIIIYLSRNCIWVFKDILAFSIRNTLDTTLFKSYSNSLVISRAFRHKELFFTYSSACKRRPFRFAILHSAWYSPLFIHIHLNVSIWLFRKIENSLWVFVELIDDIFHR